MDNLAHTLVGATLAETGLRRWTPRYSRSRDTGIGIATVTLDRELRPVP